MIIISTLSTYKGPTLLRTVFHIRSKGIHFGPPDELDDDCRENQSDEMSSHIPNKYEVGCQSEVPCDSPVFALMRMTSHSLCT